MRQQHRCRFRADTGDTGNVVHRIAGQRQIVGHLLRMHAVTGLHPGSAPAFALGIVVLLITITQQLR